MSFLILGLLISSVILFLFFLAGKMEKWDASTRSVFECGFTAYFYSRFSFSIHFLVVALIFLFLDLEICFIFPYFAEDVSSFEKIQIIFLFLVVLLSGLLEEWKEKKIEWNF